MVALDTQYNQVTFLVLHVTFFVKLCLPVFMLYFHFLFCYAHERSDDDDNSADNRKKCYDNSAFSYFYECIFALLLLAIYDRKNLTNKV